jgi:hypothetical protein
LGIDCQKTQIPSLEDIHLRFVVLHVSQKQPNGLQFIAVCLQAEMNTGLADQLAYAEEARRVAEQLAAARLAELNALKKRLKTAEKAQAAAEQRASEGELVRRKLHNTILVGPSAV